MSVYIEEYTPKSFVVRGETLNVKEDLKNLGGKWNSNLTDKKTGEKFGAWLFWTEKRKDVDDCLKNGFKQVKPIIPEINIDDLFKRLENAEKRICVLERAFKNYEDDEDSEEVVKRLL